jgi:hypothetical protein
LLPSADQRYLEEKELVCEEIPDEGMVHVVIRDFRMPAGYVPDTTDLLIKLPPGYPAAAPDMYWMKPAVRYANGAYPPAADQFMDIRGESWQRFSRHLQASPWRPGVDGLASYLLLIRHDLESGVPSD